jgi:hypothetical protein
MFAPSRWVGGPRSGTGDMGVFSARVKMSMTMENQNNEHVRHVKSGTLDHSKISIVTLYRHKVGRLILSNAQYS